MFMQAPIDMIIEGVFYDLFGVGYKLDLMYLAAWKDRIQELVTKREGRE